MVRRLADRGLIGSVSEATTHALEEALQAVVVGTQLDAIYEVRPEDRPSEDEVAEITERAGVRVPGASPSCSMAPACTPGLRVELRVRCWR